MMALNEELSWREFRDDQQSPQDKKNKLLGLWLGNKRLPRRMQGSWRILRLQTEQGGDGKGGQP